MQWSFAAWQLAEDVWKQTGNAKEKKISRWGRRARGKDCTNIRKVEQQAEGAKKICAEIRRGRTAYFCVYYTPYLCNFSNEIFAKHCIILHFLPCVVPCFWWNIFTHCIILSKFPMKCLHHICKLHHVRWPPPPPLPIRSIAKRMYMLPLYNF